MKPVRLRLAVPLFLAVALLMGAVVVLVRLPIEPLEDPSRSRNVSIREVRYVLHDEADGRTRLRIRQWLPKHLTGSAEQGWLEALQRLAVLVESPANAG